MKIVKLKSPNQYFIQVDIEFAVEYGFNEATLAGKMIRLEDNMRGKFDQKGNKWVRMTLADWAAEFPFWSDSTIRRTIESATEKKIIIARTFRGRAKWYRLNPLFDGRATVQNEQIPPHATVQNEQMPPKYLFKMNSPSVQNEHLPILNPRIKKHTTTTPDVLDEFTELFTRNFGDLTKNKQLAKDVKATLKTYGLDAVMAAINTALVDRANGKQKTWGYVKGILSRQNTERVGKNGKTKKTGGRNEKIAKKLERLKQQTTPTPGGVGM